MSSISQTGHFIIGDLNNYTGGGGLPEGDYAIWYDYFIRSQGADGKPLRGGASLCVRGTCYNLADPSAAPVEAFWGLGKGALKSFVPDPASDTGFGCKKLKLAPNAVSSNMNNLTNWLVYLENAYNAQLPKGFLLDDLSAIDGTWQRITHVDPPAARQNLKSRQTSEYQGEEGDSGPQKVAVPALFHAGGRRWLGEPGGLPPQPMSFTGAAPAMPTVAQARPVMPVAPAAPMVQAPQTQVPFVAPPVQQFAAPPMAPAAPAMPPRPAAPQVAQAAQAAVSMEQIPAMASSVIAGVLGQNPNGMPHIACRAAMFNAAKQSYGEDVANAIASTYFISNDALNSLLNPYGYQTNGAAITKAA